MLGGVWGLDPQTLLSFWNLALWVLKVNLTLPDSSCRRSTSQEQPQASSLITSSLFTINILEVWPRMEPSAPIITGLLQQWHHGPHPGTCVYTPQLNQSKVSAEGPPGSALAIDFSSLPTEYPQRMQPGPTPGHPDTFLPSSIPGLLSVLLHPQFPTPTHPPQVTRGCSSRQHGNTWTGTGPGGVWRPLAGWRQDCSSLSALLPSLVFYPGALSTLSTLRQSLRRGWAQRAKVVNEPGAAREALPFPEEVDSLKLRPQG